MAVGLVVAVLGALFPAVLVTEATPAAAVGSTPSSTTIVSSANPNVYHQSVTFTVTVSGSAATPTGSVTFFSGGSAASTKALSSGVASWTTTFAVGTTSISATYNGDATYAVSTSNTISQVTNKTSTSTTLTPSANPSTFGSPLTLTAFVAATPPGSGSPSSGTVRFYDGVTLIGSATPNVGTATMTTSSLAVGSHSLTAVFGGSASYNPSTSTPASQVVAPTVVAPAGTSTALAANPNPTAVGGSVTLTATVTSAGGVPAGTVSFSDGTTTIGSATLSGGQAVLTTSSLTVGDHSVSASFVGSASFAASTSPVVIETVGPAATTTTVARGPNPTTFGASVTLSASVISAAGTPTGSVTFLDGSAAIGTATLTNGQGSISVSNLLVGDHSINAAYGGSSTFSVSTSSATTVTVTPAPTATSVTASQDPVPVGNLVTFTATVTSAGGVPDGTVTFLDGTTVIGTGTVANGQATLATHTLAAGDHPVTAAYSGSTNFAPSTSVSITETVGVAATTTSLKITPNPSTFGDVVSLTATVGVSGGSPTGTVMFQDGSTVIGIATVARGQASIAASSLTVGAHSITAAYSGDPNFSSSASAVITQTVAPESSSTSLGATPNPTVAGTTVTFTTTVSGALGTPTGTVTFLNGTSPLGSATLAGGQATLATSALAIGGHPVTASYGGDCTFASSTSPVVTETVNAASTTSSLTSAPNPATFGGSVTFTATVTSGAGTPDGTVTFTDGPTTLGSVPLASGQATLTTNALAAGSHSVVATYGGTTTYGGSASPPTIETVHPAATSTTLAAVPNPSTYGTTVTLTATVSSAGGVPGGTVTFLDGPTTIGTATLVNGQASLTMSTLGAGAHPVTATYGATTNFSASTSSIVTQTVTVAPTSTSLVATPNPASSGSLITFTATVASAGGTPTGTVTFLDGSTAVGSSTLTGGQATLSTNTLATGTHSISASYAATANFGASASTAVSETINNTGIAVFAGYYDTHHTHNLKAKPSPWQGSPNTIFEGQPDSSNGGWDSSAVRVDNSSAGSLTLTVTVTIGSKTYNLWGAQVVPAGQTLVLAQMGYETFDGSDTNTAGCYGCNPTLCTTTVSPTVPIINVTVGGTLSRYYDRQKILNTGGADSAGCPYTGTRNDESEPWALIPGPG